MPVIEDIAHRIAQHGGRALLVGGCVRDKLLGGAPKDYDLEVFGLDAATLESVLRERHEIDAVGKSFGVYKIQHEDIDIALPRRETKLGLGHKAFEIESDPGLDMAEAAARRDFTINAIYLDPLTGECIDPWGGRKDLQERKLRHVSSHFAEDPLRVLRGMQFAARFMLDAAPETLEICRSMTPENLPPERLFDEWKKLILKGVKISKGLEFLRETGWVKHYPELEKLIGCKQNPKWHPEGDVWNHTLCALDAFAAARRDGADGHEELVVGLAVLCHDFGKPATSRYDRAKGGICSRGHDEAGVAPTLSFLRRLTNEESILKEVPPLVRAHMRPFTLWKNKSGDAAIRRLSADVKRIDRLLRVCAADDAGRPPMESSCEELKWLQEAAERLEIKDSAPRPILMGRDLVALGMKPGVAFGKILHKVYQSQLDGMVSNRDDALKMAKNLENIADSPHSGTYVIWDWNGTLLDDTQSALDTLNIMLERRGAAKIGMEFYKDNFAFPVKPFYESIGMVLENEDWDALAKEYHDTYHAQKSQKLNEKALEAIEFVEKHGVRQSILSALREDLLERDTRFFGVRDHMEFVAGVDNLDGASKLERAKALLHKLKNLHPETKKFVMIGDALHDKEVADMLGIDCILCGVGSHAAWRLAIVGTTAEDLVQAAKLALS